MKKGRHFSSSNVKVYCSGYGLIGSQTSWAAFSSNLWAPACQLLLKEMFGYWEDISVAPGLSDFQGHRGFMCHVRKYNNNKKKKQERRCWDYLQCNKMLFRTWLTLRCYMQVTQAQVQEKHTCLNSNIFWLNGVLGALNAPLQQTPNMQRSEFNLFIWSMHLFSACYPSKYTLHVLNTSPIWLKGQFVFTFWHGPHLWCT